MECFSMHAHGCHFENPYHAHYRSSHIDCFYRSGFIHISHTSLKRSCDKLQEKICVIMETKDLLTGPHHSQFRHAVIQFQVDTFLPLILIYTTFSSSWSFCHHNNHSDCFLGSLNFTPLYFFFVGRRGTMSCCQNDRMAHSLGIHNNSYIKNID